MVPALKERLERCASLPTLPALAMRVLSLCQDEDLNLPEIARAIGMDPALSAKILRIANSPLSGLRTEVKSIPHALTLLGVNTVKTLALSFSLANNLQKSAGKNLDYKYYWKRSILS